MYCLYIVIMFIDLYFLFKPPHVPRFFKLLCSRTLVCVCVCLSPRALITNHMKETRNNRIKQFYSFLYLYNAFAVNKLNGH